VVGVEQRALHEALGITPEGGADAEPFAGPFAGDATARATGHSGGGDGACVDGTAGSPSPWSFGIGLSELPASEPVAGGVVVVGDGVVAGVVVGAAVELDPEPAPEPLLGFSIGGHEWSVGAGLSEPRPDGFSIGGHAWPPCMGVPALLGVACRDGVASLAALVALGATDVLGCGGCPGSRSSSLDGMVESVG
jgi:hypothetical protein